jgi:hypothetical protein
MKLISTTTGSLQANTGCFGLGSLYWRLLLLLLLLLLFYSNAVASSCCRFCCCCTDDNYTVDTFCSAALIHCTQPPIRLMLDLGPHGAAQG